ncbi:MAG: TetR/AcrR family transcriptional regulator [Beijerinckiaceae bacterium]
MAQKRSELAGERRGYHHGRLKDAVIEAARALVAERGLAEFTLAEAAKMVGVTGAAPYRHFVDRTELLAELVRKGFDDFASGLERAWGDGGPTALSAFMRVGQAYLEFARAEPALYSAMFAYQLPHEPTAIADGGHRAQRVVQNACAAVLKQFGAPADGARSLGMQIWAITHGVAQLSISGQFARAGVDPMEMLSETAMRLVQAEVRVSIKR